MLFVLSRFYLIFPNVQRIENCSCTCLNNFWMLKCSIFKKVIYFLTRHNVCILLTCAKKNQLFFIFLKYSYKLYSLSTDLISPFNLPWRFYLWNMRKLMSNTRRCSQMNLKCDFGARFSEAYSFSKFQNLTCWYYFLL